MKIGIIGGSGIYHTGHALPEEKLNLSTPFGSPSSEITRIDFKENSLYFIARHGSHHQYLPSEVNYRANVFSLKSLGCQVLVSLSAVGSLKEDIHPGEVVLPDQFIDFTKGKRASTFFGDGVVGHVPFAKPTSSVLSQHLYSLIQAEGQTCHREGVYICTEGPQFSTQAESFFYRSLQLKSGIVSIIGMTAIPEAKLAREAGLHYQTVGLVTDYDCWLENNQVDIESIKKILLQNKTFSEKLMRRLGETRMDPSAFPVLNDRSCVITPETEWPENKREVLNVLLGS